MKRKKGEEIASRMCSFLSFEFARPCLAARKPEKGRKIESPAVSPMSPNASLSARAPPDRLYKGGGEKKRKRKGRKKKKGRVRM